MQQSFISGRVYSITNDEPQKYIKQYPRVDNDGIYMPLEEYVLEGTGSPYRLVMSKEMFVEAYNKYIKGEGCDA